MEIKKIDRIFSICKVHNFSAVDINKAYTFIGKTDEENSLVCPSDSVPSNVTDRNDGWRAFRIQGVLDFSLIGILYKITGILAENNIGVFVISTFNTDYVLTKDENYQKALHLLANAGYNITE